MKKSEKSLICSYDELSLWAAPFGLKLLEKIEIKGNLKALDLGCGTGFPSIEIAERMGILSKVFGIDISFEALKRAQEKSAAFNVKNINFINADIKNLPFKDETFDLIVSVNGINNTGNEKRAIEESFRVCRKNGSFAFTVNLPGTMYEFYRILEKVMKKNEIDGAREKIVNHINEHRKSITFYRKIISKAKFEIEEIGEDCFKMRFSNGRAMLKHHFIRLWFLKPWKDLVKKGKRYSVFRDLERELNIFSKGKEGLVLTIPYGFFKCKKKA
ncbi:MAG: class I SAM-dependent methyltransferase [Thermoanaerobaculia bacterium]